MQIRPLTRPALAVAAVLLVLATGPTAAETPTAATPAAPSAEAAALGDAPAIPTRVVRLRRDRPSTFTIQEQRFRRDGRIDPAELPLPLPVLLVSTQGYVLVQAPQGQLWLDAMSVVLDPPPQVAAECPPGLSGREDIKIAGAPGVGEGC